jgi:hypothetical protein
MLASKGPLNISGKRVKMSKCIKSIVARRKRDDKTGGEGIKVYRVRERNRLGTTR